VSSPEALWVAGDFLAGIAMIYTDVLGPVFYGIVIFLMILPLYLKTNSVVLPLGVLILLSGLVEIALPAPAVDLARFLVIIFVAGGLFLLVTRGRVR